MDPITNRPSQADSQRGASLIEIMVATLIISFVALGMVEFFADGHIGFNREENKRVAVLLAQEALERTVAQTYDEIGPWEEQRTVSNIGFTITVATQTDAPEQNMKAVICSVTWEAMPTVNRTATLETYVFDN